MSSQTIRYLRRQSRAISRLSALLLALACLSAPLAPAATLQKAKGEAARKAFAEAEMLRERGTQASLGEAVAKYDEAVKLARADGDREGETMALASLGVTLQLLHRHDKAVEAYARALALLGDAGEGAASLLYNMGSAQLYLSRFDDAAASYARALEIQRRLGDRAGEADTLSYLGGVYVRTGRYAQAVESLERSLAIQRALGDRAKEGVLLSNLGTTYNDLGRFDRALKMFESALAAYREARDRKSEGTTLANAGYALFKLGRTPEAVEHYGRALAVQRELSDRPQEANTLTKLALAQLAQGKSAEALTTARRALALHRELKDRYGESRALDVLGQVHRALGEHDRSLEHLGAALALTSELGARTAEAATLGEMMLTLRARGSSRLAIFYGKRAVNNLQELRQSIGRLGRESQDSFVGARQETYRTLAGLLIAEGRLPEAQQVLDMLKQDEYMQFIRRDGGESAAMSARSALSPEEAALELRYREISSSIVSIGRERGELAAKESLTAEEQKRLDELEKRLVVASAYFQKSLDKLGAELPAETGAGGKVYQLREAEALQGVLRDLGGGAVALYTVVSADKYHVILYTPDATVAREHAIAAPELHEKIHAFRRALQDYTRDPRPAAQALYKVLVGPVAKDLEQARAETLMWSLDGALRYVPVAALHDGERYMVERYRNVVFTPASQANLKDEPRAQSKGVGFGVSKAHGEFIALPAVPEELRSIFRVETAAATTPAQTEPASASTAEAVGVLPGRVLLDEKFTRDEFRSSLRRGYPVVHIASHFAFKPGDETDSFLLLGDGSRLSLEQISATPKFFEGVDLLTLSACDTATGGSGGNGQEVEGFAVLAQRKGAKAVLASLWPVSDASTRLLMQEFYRLRGGENVTKAEALKRAQLALLRGGVTQVGGDAGRGIAVRGGPGLKFSHPFFWAPFILIGNWK